MLLYLHVQNYTLIDDIEMEFTDGLNILTGETGAGKSILLGSVSAALGAKTKTDVIKEGEESAFVELHFSIDHEGQRELLKELEIDCEDDVVMIQRRITQARSTAKINGVSVTNADLRKVADTFLDIYGQHDYQNLLKESMHIEILDSYAGDELKALKSETKEAYDAYKVLKHEMDGLETDAEKRQREIDFLAFELKEIEEADLKEGEEEELRETLRLAENAEKIAKALSGTERFLSDNGGVMDQFSRSFYELKTVSGMTDEISGFEDSLKQAQDIVSDVRRSMADYLENLSFDEQKLAEDRERYDFINTLFMKYGRDVADVKSFYEKKLAEYEKLCKFEEYKAELSLKLKKAEDTLSDLCEKLTEERKKEGLRFTKEVSEALADLNFNDNRFEIEFEENESYTAKGKDIAKFFISTNVGEPLRPLCEVASGGELSRIMLAIKTVSAGRDLIHTLIFDEVDAGISGNTAWKVSEKLGKLSQNLQVICITHLPQIAAMADNHFEISKHEKDGHTVTEVKKLFQYESVEELTRLLGGGEKTEAAKANAKELISQAKKLKHDLKI
ncbi:MAG: DNA repair protein RecN [Lachnospiraceae bacterium]|nr:DNA repair protein RecN [Lachnospiraceae bacterium]